MYKAILYIAYCSCLYILLCKLSYGYHNQAHFIYIFKMESFSAVKFSMSYEKNVGFLVIPKLPKFGNKVKTMGLGAFKFRLGHWKQILFFPSRFLFW